VSWIFNPFTNNFDYFQNGGSAGVSGTVTADFGIAPGKSYMEIPVTGQTGIEASSIVITEKSIVPTADHTLQDIIVTDLDISVGNIVPGVGFTIYILSKIGRITGQYVLKYVWQ
jgi:hypothetical protein